MKITKMISQNRRDFSAEYTCEGCDHKQIDNSGYDDKYYHENVIPNIQCKNCKESTITLGRPIEPQATKYPENYVV